MAHQQTQPPRDISAKTLNPTSRFRAACDFCHQAKVKCSGDNPCSSCQSSSLRCVYSPASRQGRPKGSKNKRKLLEELKATTTKEYGPSSLSQQQTSMGTDQSLDLVQDFGSISARNAYIGGSDLLDDARMESSPLDIGSHSCFENALNTVLSEQKNVRTHRASLGDLHLFATPVSAFDDPKRTELTSVARKRS